MARSKRYRTPSPASSPRRSKRIRRTPQALSQPSRGLPSLSTDTETEDWEKLAAAAEARITQYQPKDRHREDLLQDSLKAFINWLPRGGRESVARDIRDAKTDDDLYKVFMNLYKGLAMPMKALSKPSSMIESPHSKRVRQVEVGASHLDESQTRDDMFKASCLRRDGYRCIFSGFMQIAHWLQLNEPDAIKAAHVEVAHTIPFSYASWRTTESRHEAASAWRVLYSCFPGVRRAGLSAETINCESNGLTMQRECHADFGNFKLAFKPVENENNKHEVKTYRGCSALTRMWSPASGFIELKQADDAKDLKLPDRDYLDCHWRITEIFNASGMGEVIDKQFQEWEDLKGTCHELREDGTTNVDRFLRADLWADVAG